jgi:muramoyltetrapeptide carboxypeptidase
VDPKRDLPTAEQVVEEVLAPLGLPLVLGLPFGHGRPNLPWPVGARAALDGERGELRLLEEGVER